MQKVRDLERRAHFRGTPPTEVLFFIFRASLSILFKKDFATKDELLRNCETKARVKCLCAESWIMSMLKAYANIDAMI